MPNKIKIFMLAILFTGCSDGVSEKLKLAAIEQNKAILAFTCEGYGSRSTAFGDLQNNIWNAHSAQGFEWTQCLAMRTLDANTQYGWYWQWPEDGNKVYAQPQITLGNTPWLQHNQVKSGYPISVNQLEKLDIDYSLEILSDGELNLATTLWLTHSDTIQTEIDKSTIAAQVMIWTYASDDFYANPAGEEVGEITISGIEWEVWWDQSWQDMSGKNDNNWVYLAFRTSQSLMNIKFDAAEMLRHAIKQKLITSDLYIADIQLGTEIMSGTGQVWLNHYQVNVVLAGR
ncbi:MAG: hypothetical protein ACJASL_003997 [Paraglaciecola sp.]|jgi:hypothetical protein